MCQLNPVVACAACSLTELAVRAKGGPSRLTAASAEPRCGTRASESTGVRRRLSGDGRLALGAIEGILRIRVVGHIVVT